MTGEAVATKDVAVEALHVMSTEDRSPPGGSGA